MALKMPSFLRTARPPPRRRTSRRRQLRAARRAAPAGGERGERGQRDHHRRHRRARSEPSVSADGRFVAFSRPRPTSCPAGDANGVKTSTPRPRTTLTAPPTPDDPGQLNAPTPRAGNGASASPRSARTAVSSPSAAPRPTLSPARANNDDPDIYLRDLRDQHHRAGEQQPRRQPPSDFSAEPHTNGNGNFVAYTSRAGNIAPAGVDRTPAASATCSCWNVTHDRAGAGRRHAGHVSGNRGSFDPSVSANGQFVAFRSEANDLAPGVDTNTSATSTCAT